MGPCNCLSLRTALVFLHSIEYTSHSNFILKPKPVETKILKENSIKVWAPCQLFSSCLPRTYGKWVKGDTIVEYMGIY